MKKYILTLCTVLVFILNFKNVEAISDFSGGTSSGGSIGSGSWLSRYVGLKVSIVSSTNVLKETKIFVNSSGIAGKISHQALKPKTKQSKQISWVSSSNLGTNLITKTTLPSAWMDSKENNINIHGKLSDSNYRILLDMLNSFTMKNPGDYILVEPMVYIGGYYGTAFELGNDFMNSSYDNSFADTYKRRLFSGNSSMKDGGLFYTTIYLTSDVTPIGLSEFRYSKTDLSETRKFKERNDCLLSQNCGRGIGVFKYDDIYSGKLKIVKKETGTNKVISGAGFTLYSDSSCRNIIKNQQTTNSSGEVIFDNLATGNYYYKETKVPSGYTGDSNCKPIPVTNGYTTSIVVNNIKNATQGNLNIYIKNNVTKELITNINSQASYDIYKGANCSGTKIKTVNTSSGFASINNLDIGTYSIKEVKAPENYEEKKDKCVKPNVLITANATKEEVIFYDPSCEMMLKESDGSISSLLNLYEKFGFRGLLNFQSPKCKDDVVCPNHSNSSPVVDCLQGSISVQPFNKYFNEYNMSCFDDPLKNINDKLVGFCINTFELNNNLGVNKFYNKSGQFLIRKNENNKLQFYKNKNELVEVNSPYVASGNVGRICYVLNGNVPSQEKTQRLSLKVYFGNNNPDDDDVVKVDELSYIKNSSSTSEYVNNGFVKYHYVDNYNFNLNTVYLERITGKVVSKKNTTLQGTGIIIPFKPISDEKKYIPFKLNYNNKDFSSKKCKYESDHEIIKYPTKKGKIDLEFRLINMQKPFLNENGEIRQTNSNWCDYSAIESERCNANNNVVIENIINAPDSYGRNATNPIYRIELTSSDIKIIREYNKENSYDNYELYCETHPLTGENSCESLFIKDLKNGILNKYENGTKIKKYGNLTTSLIVPKQ